MQDIFGLLPAGHARSGSRSAKIMPPESKNLLARIAMPIPEGMKGIGWVASATWGVQAIRLITLAVLASYLLPATFGFFAFALAIFTIAQPIVGMGIPEATVVKPELEPNSVASGLMMATLSGTMGMAVMYVGFLVMSQLDPQLDELRSIGWMIPGLLLANIANASLAFPRRQKNFSALALAFVAGESAGSGIGIYLAISGEGIDSLVWRYLVTAAVMAAFGLWLVRHQFARPSMTAGKNLLRYGLPVAGSETLAALRNRGDELLVGALFGAATLGVYGIARRYVDAVRAALPAVIGDHAWPVLASMRDNSRAFAKQLRRSLILVGGLVWPAFVGLGILASQWVPIVLGPDWFAAIPVIWALSAVGILQSAVAIPILAIVGLGHTAAKLRLDITLTVVTLAMILALSGLDLVGLLIAILTANIVVLPYQIRTVSDRLPVGLAQVLPAMVVPLIANLVLAAGLVAIATQLAGTLSAIAICAAGIALCALVPMILILARGTIAYHPPSR